MSKNKNSASILENFNGSKGENNFRDHLYEKYETGFSSLTIGRKDIPEWTSSEDTPQAPLWLYLKKHTYEHINRKL